MSPFHSIFLWLLCFFFFYSFFRFLFSCVCMNCTLLFFCILIATLPERRKLCCFGCSGIFLRFGVSFLFIFVCRRSYFLVHKCLMRVCDSHLVGKLIQLWFCFCMLNVPFMAVEILRAKNIFFFRPFLLQVAACFSVASAWQLDSRHLCKCPVAAIHSGWPFAAFHLIAAAFEFIFFRSSTLRINLFIYFMRFQIWGWTTAVYRRARLNCTVVFSCTHHLQIGSPFLYLFMI